MCNTGANARGIMKILLFFYKKIQEMGMFGWFLPNFCEYEKNIFVSTLVGTMDKTVKYLSTVQGRVQTEQAEAL